ncbi:protein NUCLEAR FUSION DEFECTIVE 4-like [Senna tora]|uniref:Protein NUCLEAR FUSION DEFECTIVE 4-like n=1 Tax=Senna tora TaxID=362788 RepID=A0A834XIV9_9FABA|nr:protein NUCLEAR FUSION DEFECTIVE 4-like [Senna tora]
MDSASLKDSVSLPTASCQSMAIHLIKSHASSGVKSSTQPLAVRRGTRDEEGEKENGEDKLTQEERTTEKIERAIAVLTLYLCIGFITRVLCETSPLWSASLVGAALNFIGYGWVWLIVIGRAPALPFRAMSNFPFFI